MRGVGLLKTIAQIFPAWWRRYAVAAAAFAGVHLVAFPRFLEGLAGPLPEAQWMPPPSRVIDYIGRLGEGGRMLYGIFQVVDLLFIAAYGGLLGSGLVLSGRRVAPRWVGLLAAPVALAISADVTENGLILLLIGAWSDPWAPLLAASTFVVSAKFLLVAIAAICFAVVTVLAWQAVRRRESGAPATPSAR